MQLAFQWVRRQIVLILQAFVSIGVSVMNLGALMRGIRNMNGGWVCAFVFSIYILVFSFFFLSQILILDFWPAHRFEIYTPKICGLASFLCEKLVPV